MQGTTYMHKQQWLWALVWFFVLLVAGMLWSRYQPFCNWDLIPYAAIVYGYEGLDARAAHSAAYALVQTSLPEGCADPLLHETAYRQQCAADWVFFNSQLPFYRVKPLYTGFIFLLHRSGLNLWTALQLPSAIGFAGVGVALMFWLLPFFRLAGAALLSALLLVSFALQLPRLITPDALAAMGLLFFMHELYVNGVRRVYKLAIWLALLTLCRIDHILFALPLLYMLWQPVLRQAALPKKMGMLAVVLAGIVGAAVLLSLLLHNEPDWYFQYRFFEGASEYGRHLARSLLQFAQTKLPLLLALLWVTRPIADPKWRLVLFVMLAGTLVRWLLFPTFQERFFVAHELLLAVYLLQKLKGLAMPQTLNNLV